MSATRTAGLTDRLYLYLWPDLLESWAYLAAPQSTLGAAFPIHKESPCVITKSFC